MKHSKRKIRNMEKQRIRRNRIRRNQHPGMRWRQKNGY